MKQLKYYGAMHLKHFTYITPTNIMQRCCYKCFIESKNGHYIEYESFYNNHIQLTIFPQIPVEPKKQKKIHLFFTQYFG